MRYLMIAVMLLNFAFAQFQYSTLIELDSICQSYIDNIPRKGENKFTTPSECEAFYLERIVEDILKDEVSLYTEAMGMLFSYGVDVRDEIIILYPKGDIYWGTYIFNRFPNKMRVFQSVHPLGDKNTSLQTFEAFYHYPNSIGIMLSGTHREDTREQTYCDGDYFISDVAHNTRSAFHIITRYISNYYKNSIFIQFHGFAQKNEDPDIILSNGTKSDKGQVFNNVSYFMDDKYPDINIKFSHTADKLLATQNVQGRLLNGAKDACNSYVSVPSNRFFHIEQAYFLRKDEKARQTAISFIKLLD